MGEALLGKLSGVEFWESGENLVLLPGHLSHEEESIRQALGEAGRSGTVVFATSGSGGRQKMVCLSKRALLASAGAVNTHLKLTTADVWFRAIPLFHVGGFGIHARAYLGGVPAVVHLGKWDPEEAARQMGEVGATLVPLVPTQVFDLVHAGVECPPAVRAVVVGGGKLEPGMAMAARGLGWPVLPSYGMTEAASQIATAPLGSLQNPEFSTGMEVLPTWRVRKDGRGCLGFSGEALFEGYLVWEEGGYTFQNPCVGGWFWTEDQVELGGQKGGGSWIGSISRVGRVVKILGELVDLSSLEEAVGGVAAVVAVPDARRGGRLYLVVDEERARATDLHVINEGRPGFERIEAVVPVPELPRSEMGKIRYAELDMLVAERFPAPDISEGEERT